jgi:single-strand DNA-binding protein
VWGQRAEMVAKYLRKGAYVRVVGESETNEYTDRESIKRWSTQINAQSVDFLEPRDDADQDLPDAAPEETGAPAGDDIPL